MGQTFNRNAYESNLTGPLVGGATSVAVDSAAGLTAPIYLVIDPDVPAKREWVRVNTINVNTLDNLVRNLTGSVGDISHDAGAVIRSIPTQQIFEDIFTDIAADVLNLTQHETDGGDPHAQAGYLTSGDADGLYVKLTGGVMTGALTVPTPPTAAGHAAAKDYVDSNDAGLQASIDTNTTDIGLVAADLVTHEATPSAHHTKYTDGEAVTAVGPHTTKYTDVEARAAVDDGTYLKLTAASQTLTGDLSMVGRLSVNGRIEITETNQTFLDPKARNVVINAGVPGAVAVKGSLLVDTVGGNLLYSDGVSWIVAVTGV